MKVDWITTFSNAVAVAVVIVLLVAIFSDDIVAPGAMIVVACASTAVALWLFIMLSFVSFRRAARGEADGPTGDEAVRAITRINDDQWGMTILRAVLLAQSVATAFIFGAASAEFLAAFSAFSISISLQMRQIKNVGSSQ